MDTVWLKIIFQKNIDLHDSAIVSMHYRETKMRGVVTDKVYTPDIQKALRICPLLYVRSISRISGTHWKKEEIGQR